MDSLVYKMSAAIVLVFAYSIQASELTIGPKGINSIATGLKVAQCCFSWLWSASY